MAFLNICLHFSDEARLCNFEHSKMDQEFYSIKETAAIFGVHSCTIRRAIKMKFLIAIRIGNGPRSPYRISKESIRAIHISMIKELAKKAEPV
jgi:AraC-like DNA-binding protein